MDDAGRPVPRRISAWAEEPIRPAWRRVRPTAHLRVGGGASPGKKIGRIYDGASPRGRRSRPGQGLRRVPRGRISAWAEEPPRARAAASRPRAHLRVGGGAPGGWLMDDEDEGASPRGRRSPRAEHGGRPGSGRISAWAEEPSAPRRCRRRAAAHLRVGGGAVTPTRRPNSLAGASPRGRRSRRQPAPGPAAHGRISAWAEEPRRASARGSRRRAHLRVGGGAPPITRERSTHTGASPRGRRSRELDRHGQVQPRRISAWAEEPSRSAARSARPGAHLRVGGGASVPAWHGADISKRQPPLPTATA